MHKNVVMRVEIFNNVLILEMFQRFISLIIRYNGTYYYLR